MGFKNIVRCQSSSENQEPSTTPTNVNAMKYLRHVVPKMFQVQSKPILLTSLMY